VVRTTKARSLLPAHSCDGVLATYFTGQDLAYVLTLCLRMIVVSSRRVFTSLFRHRGEEDGEAEDDAGHHHEPGKIDLAHVPPPCSGADVQLIERRSPDDGRVRGSTRPWRNTRR
jgi:hypothetical protein